MKIYHYHGQFPKNSQEEIILSSMAKKCPASYDCWCDSWEYEYSLESFVSNWPYNFMVIVKKESGERYIYVTHYSNFGQR